MYRYNVTVNIAIIYYVDVLINCCSSTPSPYVHEVLTGVGNRTITALRIKPLFDHDRLGVHVPWLQCRHSCIGALRLCILTVYTMTKSFDNVWMIIWSPSASVWALH